MEAFFQLFLKEKTYLCNVTAKTIRFYKQSFTCFRKHFKGDFPAKIDLTQWVIGMKESGLSTVSCNVYIRGTNSFFSWCFENEHCKEHLKAKQIKEEKKTIQTFSEAQLRMIISYRGKSFGEWRLHAILCLLIDTGNRIEEALSLKREKVDFDNLLITVFGKGQTIRVRRLL
jgi:site-specific recombinase XerD